MPSWLFHNNGDGTFTDVSRSSGIAKSLGKAWGVVATDMNNDGWMDLFVANDNRAAAQNHWLGLQLVGKKPTLMQWAPASPGRPGT